MENDSVFINHLIRCYDEREQRGFHNGGRAGCHRDTEYAQGSKWLSAFLESYRPPLDGEHYLTDREVAEMLRVSRRTLQEYRNNRMLPFILLAGKVLYPESGLRELLEANYLKPLE